MHCANIRAASTSPTATAIHEKHVQSRTEIAAVPFPSQSGSPHSPDSSPHTPTSSVVSVSSESTAHNQLRLYRGHRRKSWIAWDVDELVELRARQRTFDGAYLRAALSCLGYGLFILKIFSDDFGKIGLVYFVLGILLLGISYVRKRRSDRDFTDIYQGQSSPHNRGTQQPQLQLHPENKHEIKQNAGTGRIWGRSFRTSGFFVLVLAAVVIVLDISLLVLILRI